MKPVKLLIIGAGDRGTTYAQLSQKTWPPSRVVGLAEPRQELREELAKELGIDADHVFEDWEQAAERDKFADAAVIATPDGLHATPALAFLDKGYHLLLEKPMATTVELCRTLVEAAKRNKSIFAVGHVLRYTPYTQRLKLLLDSGIIGDVMAVQRLEPIGFDHFAHSYVRGNWRREEESAFSLLTKACHDLDWLRYIIGAPCRELSSFGELRHFYKENKPEGAADRCLDCSVERSCPYSAKRIYLDPAVIGKRGWPLNVITHDPKPSKVIDALRTGPYGRCVYECDNDVVDTQAVNMVFDGGCLASFVMTAFTPMGGRKTTLFGSKGQLSGDGRHIDHFDFLTGKTTHYDTADGEKEEAGGHGGGDMGLLNAFVRAVSKGNPAHILSSPRESLESHLMAFAAEKARLDRTVEKLDG